LFRCGKAAFLNRGTFMPRYGYGGHQPMIEEEDARRAYWFFITSWLGRNGVIGTKSGNNHFCTRYTANGGIQGVRFVSAVDSIPAWRPRWDAMAEADREAVRAKIRREEPLFSGRDPEATMFVFACLRDLERQAKIQEVPK
jgi:hypothetical protein